jgi:hypothetical protein
MTSLTCLQRLFATRSSFHTRLFVSTYECHCTYVRIYVRTYTRQARQPGLLVCLKFEDNDATTVARIRQSRGKVVNSTYTTNHICFAFSLHVRIIVAAITNHEIDLI